MRILKYESTFTSELKTTKKIKIMSTLKSNPIYSKMFAAIEIKTTEEIEQAIMLLELKPASKEKSISMACMFEVLENRDVQRAITLMNALDAIAA